MPCCAACPGSSTTVIVPVHSLRMVKCFTILVEVRALRGVPWYTIRGDTNCPAWRPLPLRPQQTPSSTQDHFRKVVKPSYTNVFRDRGGVIGVVEFDSRDDMKRAIRKLDDTEFKNPFEKAYVRVIDDSDGGGGGGGGSRGGRSVSRSPRRSRSRGRSYSRSRSRSRGRSASRSPSRSPSRSKSPTRSPSRSRSPAANAAKRSRSRSGSPRD